MSDDSRDRRGGDSDATDEEQGEPGDPFDSFDKYSERSGDPFETLGDDGAVEDDGAGVDGDATDDPSTADPPGGADPFEYVEGSDDAHPQAADREGGQPVPYAPGESPDPETPVDSRSDTAGDPLGDVDVSDGDPFESNASAFERSDIDGIDPDDVWERLTGDTDADGDTNTDGDTEAGSDVPPTEDDDVVEVPKHSYCEGCEYFSSPPDVECTHEGTEILEFVDIDTVKVANCPVVEERRELEDER